MLGEIAEESDRENPNAKTAFVYKHNDTIEVQHDEDENKHPCDADIPGHLKRQKTKKTDENKAKLSVDISAALAESDSDSDDDVVIRCTVTSSAKPETACSNEESEEDEDNILTSTKKKVKRRVALEDSDEDSCTSMNKENVSESAEMTIKDPQFDDNSMSATQRGVRSLMDSDDESVASQNQEEEKKSLTPHRRVRPVTDSDDSDSEQATGNNCENQSAKVPVSSQPNTLNSDLFDAEMDSDEESVTKNDEDRDKKVESGSSEDEDDSPGKLTRALKGAGKDKTQSGRRKMKQEAVQKIHSETQRLVRESRVQLPYHQPTPPSLQQFLQRTAQKQAQLSSMGIRAAAIKAKPEVLLKQKSRESHRGKKPQDKGPSNGDESKSSDNITNSESHKASDEVSMDKQTPDDGGVKLTSGQSTTENVDLDNDEDLPDMFDVGKNQEEVSSKNKGDKIDELPDIVSEVSKTNSESKGIESSHDDMNTNSVVDTENDSGVVVSQFVNSEDDLSNKNSCTAEIENEENDSVLTKDSEKTPCGEKSKNKSLLTPKLQALGLTDLAPKLQSFTPKLQSSASDCLIDLDEDFATPPTKPKGLDTFIARTMSHAIKKTTPKAKTPIQLGFIHKVKSPENEKEELKRDTITYTEDEPDPVTVDKPGARWLSVKEQLKLQMKVKREEARSKRCEMYELDNEEGFGDDGEEEEEAELTDQTDTDEEEIMDEEEEDEELDEAEYGREEKQKSNPFVDDEADDEDDEDDGQDDEDDGQDADTDHLQEDEEDADDKMDLKLDVSDDEESQAVTAQKPVEKPNFLSGALQKNQTMDLFDDYEDDSYAVSNDNGRVMTSTMDIHETVASSAKLNDAVDKPLVSDRPFGQLSQEKKSVITVTDNDSIVDLKSENSNASSTKPRSDLERDASFNSMDTSFEMIGSLIPAHQPGGGMKYGGRQATYDNSASKLSKSSRSLSELTLPIEDTQDLCDSPLRSQSTPKVNESQNYHFSLDDDTQSQMLDADGFLKLNSSEKKPPKRSLQLDSPAASQDMDELLALCSGQFSAGTQAGTQAVSKKSLFSQLVDTQSNMDELLLLCSGTFTESTQNTVDGTQPKSGKKRIREEDEDSNSSFGFEVTEDDDDTANMPTQKVTLDSDDEIESKKKQQKPRRHIEESDEDEDDDADGSTDKQEKFGGFLLKKGKLRQDFVEEEAELSGSEAESDENEDLDEDEDVLEMMEGDQDDVLPEHELRDQVGRVHLKKMIDEDKRELMLMQEMYLTDGDLHSDGAGRMRRFRWANADKGYDENRGGDSDEEKEENNEDETDAETRWRMQRYEREKFLESQVEDNDENDSQFIKLGKVVFKHKKSESTPSPMPVVKAKATEKAAPSTSPKSLFKLPTTHGSFLKRSKEQLAKIAESSKSSVNPLATRNSRNFLFSADSQEEEVKKKPAPRRSVSMTTSSQPAAKKPRLDRGNSLPKDSIFNLL